MRRPALAFLLGLVAALVLAACADDAADTDAADDTDDADAGVVIGAFEFPESLLLATLYAEALEATGVEVTDIQQVGAREATFPALETGEIDVLPEYSGNALDYVLGGEATVEDPETTVELLRAELEDNGLLALDAASAQNGDELAMTAERADELGVSAVSDLAPHADELVVAGPPEFLERSTGLPGIEDAYGFTFGDFLQTDACGPETFDALGSGDADVARLCSTDPPIAEQGWVVLEEDVPFTLANNIVPVAREGALSDDAIEALNAVSAALATEDLREFNVRFAGEDPEDADAIVGEWIDAQGLR